MDRLQDILDDIQDSDLSVADNEDETSETDNLDEAPEEDKPGEDPVEDTEDSGKTEAESPEEEDTSDKEDDDAEDEGEGDESEEPEGESDDEPSFEIDGEKYTLSQLREFRDNGLRQGDYTRKTTEVARLREELQQSSDSQRELSNEIVSDSNMRELIQDNPELLPYLLATPGATRKLIGNADKIREFKEDYEVLSTNDRMAERFLANTGEDERRAGLQREKMMRATVAVADAVNDAVTQVGKDYEGVDANEVRGYLKELSGIGDEPSADDMVQAMGRLYSLMFVQTGNKESPVALNPSLIKDRFELLSAREAVRKKADEDRTQQHNKQVDEELQNEPEGDSPDGDAPGADVERVDPPTDLREVLDSLSI